MALKRDGFFVVSITYDYYSQSFDCDLVFEDTI